MKTPKENPNPTIFLSSLCGYIAMWATRQSPYNAPDGLTQVLKDFQTHIALREFPKMAEFTDVPCAPDQLRHILKCDLLVIPQVRAWNERRNGNRSPYGFCSRYDRPNPDDDFIDLDALVGNIVRSCVEDSRRSWQEHYERKRWIFGKRWRWLTSRRFRGGVSSAPGACGPA